MKKTKTLDYFVSAAFLCFLPLAAVCLLALGAFFAGASLVAVGAAPVEAASSADAKPALIKNALMASTVRILRIENHLAFGVRRSHGWMK